MPLARRSFQSTHEKKKQRMKGKERIIRKGGRKKGVPFCPALARKITSERIERGKRRAKITNPRKKTD